MLSGKKANLKRLHTLLFLLSNIIGGQVTFLKWEKQISDCQEVGGREGGQKESEYNYKRITQGIFTVMEWSCLLTMVVNTQIYTHDKIV